MDFNQIQELIRLVSKQKISEFIYKEGDVKLIIRQGSATTESVSGNHIVQSAPAPVVTAAPAFTPALPTTESAPTPAPAPPPAAPVSVPVPAANTITIKSPMVGTFYRSGGPDKPPFLKIGDVVEIGARVCIIEAMKLFNEIESDVKGTVVKILVDDATPVEYDQPLFLLEP